MIFGVNHAPDENGRLFGNDWQEELFIHVLDEICRYTHVAGIRQVGLQRSKVESLLPGSQPKCYGVLFVFGRDIIIII
jgi:hypothetical protein